MHYYTKQPKRHEIKEIFQNTNNHQAQKYLSAVGSGFKQPKYSMVVLWLFGEK